MPNIPLRNLAVALFAVDFLLVAAYILGTFIAVPDPHIYRLINLDAEASLGAWFSASQLFLTGVIFAAAAHTRRDDSAQTFFLPMCALAFFFLSADEAASIHEKITMLFRGVEYLPRFSGNHGIWIPIYALLGILFLMLTWKSWLRIWRTQKSDLVVFLTGVGLFVCGAVALEIISYGELRELSNRKYYVVQVLFEEALELVGVTLIVIGTLRVCFGQTQRSNEE